jgi:GNAT superfamily N-acetyltransferase
MPITIRNANPETDYDAAARLISQYQNQAITGDDIREWDKRQMEGMIRRRAAAVTEVDQIVGCSTMMHEPWDPPGKFYMWLCVDAAATGQGIGAQLYHDALAFCQTHGVTQIISQVNDNDPTSQAFAQRRSFRQDRHIFESVIRLAEFDETPFTHITPAVLGQGIRLLSLTEVGDTPDVRRQLYEVNRATALDIPGRPMAFSSYEEFVQIVFNAAWFNPAAQILALDGDKAIGLAAVRFLGETNTMYNLMTGVLPEYRGRNIALALKLHTIRLARAWGAIAIRTHNDSQNAPMLAINRKLGYQPEPGYYMLVKELDA